MSLAQPVECLGQTLALLLVDLERSRRHGRCLLPGRLLPRELRMLGTRFPHYPTLRLRLNGLGPAFLDRFAAVLDRFSGSWCRFLESWGQDGEDGEKTGKKRRKMGEKWPKESGSNDGLTANAE